MLDTKIKMLERHSNIALIRKESKLSYEALLQKVAAYASLMPRKSGSKVAIYSENRLEWVYAFYGAWKKECITVPIDFMSTSKEVAYIISDAEPEIIFCSAAKLDVLKEAVTSLSNKLQIIVFEDIDESALKAEDESFPEVDIEDTAVFIYTSGTTGGPKGVVLTFNNLLVNVKAVSSEETGIYQSDDRLLVLLPLHHILPLLGSLICPLYLGATAVFSPSLASEDVGITLREHHCTIIIGVPRFYDMISKGVHDKIKKSLLAQVIFKIAGMIQSKGLSKLLFKKVHQRMGGQIKYCICGGAAIDSRVEKDFQILGFELLTGYGMTEAAPMITFTRPGTARIGASGQALSCTEIKIEDGEILARGPNVMRGYYNRPDETDQVLQSGWLHTGDLGYIDKDGFLFLTGRKKEIIILPNGKNINPVELEFSIRSMSDYIKEIGIYLKDGMLQAAVYPDLDKLKQDEVHNIRAKLISAAIDPFNKTVSPYKRLKNIVVFGEELPKTRLGKIKRFELQSLSKTGIEKKQESSSEPEYEELTVLKNYLRSKNNKDVFSDDHLELDLGLDSLDMVSLQTFLNNTFGLNENENLFLDYPIVGRLAQYVREHKIRIDIETVHWSDVFQEKLDIKLPRTWFTMPLLRNLGLLLLNIYFIHVKGEGVENIPDEPCIIAPNHQSFYDGLFVVKFFRTHLLKRTYFYAKAKHVKQWWVKFLAGTNNVIIMDVDRNLKRSLQEMAEAIKCGKNVIIFPEGTRAIDGKIREFKKTFAILSRELNVPVLPIAINGAFKVFPSGSIFPRPFKHIDIKFLKPIYPDNMTYENLNEKVFDTIKANVQKKTE